MRGSVNRDEFRKRKQGITGDFDNRWMLRLQNWRWTGLLA
jgi:hypothetical protein